MSVSSYPSAISAALGAPLTITRSAALAFSTGEDFNNCGDPGPTQQLTFTANGGTPPYSFSYLRVTAQATYGPFSPNSPASNVTDFEAPGLVCADAVIIQETWRCRVTDDVGAVADVFFNVRITWTNLS